MDKNYLNLSRSLLGKEHEWFPHNKDKGEGNPPLLGSSKHRCSIQRHLSVVCLKETKILIDTWTKIIATVKSLRPKTTRPVGFKRIARG